MPRLFAAALALGLMAGAGAANAQPRLRCDNDGRCVQDTLVFGQKSTSRFKGSTHKASDPRPRAWCGWWMRRQLGVADRAYNRARHWARYGIAAAGSAEGVIVVWPHHVGVVTGRTDDGRWIVKSGNDGHRVRERVRSLRGAIAFRWPEQRWASR
jgi:hypothetical protein